MAYRFPNRQMRHRPRPNVSKVGVFPAPTGGVDGRITLAAQDMSTCPYAYNLVPDEYGMRIRKGYREHVIGVESVNGQGVRTIIPFEAIDSTNDKLFAVTNEGIWDVTAYNTTPTLKFTFTAFNLEETGWGNFINYVTAAGDQLILYADSKNGLFTYDANTDTWAQTTGITGVSAADIVGVMVHKLRVWFVERNSTNAWYLDPNAITGAATKFTFGSKFKYGGNLATLHNWTLDGGDGVDDYLVAVSSSGDVLPYQGEDPSSASTWSLRGSYYIGIQPKGYRTGVELGGDLYLLSSFGLISMTELLNGNTPSALRRDSVGYKISKILQTSMEVLRDENGWDLQFFPSAGVLILISPPQPDGTYLQYVLNLVTQGWGFWRGVPIINAGVWRNEVYFGTADSRIMVMDVYRDNQLITPVGAVNGEPIEYSLLHSYNDMGSGGLQKRGLLVRPNFRSRSAPSYATKILYDYEIAEASLSFPVINNNIGLWDSGIWNTSEWGAGSNAPFSRSTGGGGIGRSLAVAIQGETVTDTLLVSTDLVWDEGGVL